jgi:hypothetical protein
LCPTVEVVFPLSGCIRRLASLSTVYEKPQTNQPNRQSPLLLLMVVCTYTLVEVAGVGEAPAVLRAL